MKAANPHAVPAALVLGLLALIVVAPMAGLLNLSGLPGYESGDLKFWNNAYIRRVLVFSLWQAMLSALLSVAPAILVARAFALHPDFPLRSLLLRLFALPLVVPAVVAVMGVVSVYGSDGWIPLGRSLYGINGILLAHVFFNLPLAVLLLLPQWQTIPRHHWQLADQLGMNAWQRWRYLEWPALREALPGVMLLVFMLCLTSFAVVLTLGGGPRSTTLEVAIYQSLRFDFDPAQAVVLALLQLALCLLVAALTLKFQRLPEVEITVSASAGQRPRAHRPLNLLLILAAAVFVGMPLLSMLIDALAGPLLKAIGNIYLWQSIANTLFIGLSAALLAVVAGWFLLQYSASLARAGQSGRAKLVDLAGSIVYVVPPLVIGTGMFVLLSSRLNVFDWVYPIVIAINAVMGLPFVIRTLGPALRQNHARYQYLCQSLALQGWNRFRFLEWPLLRRPLGLATALVAALAMGDLGVIALFGTPDTATLALLVYQQLGAYLITHATVTALVLLMLCLVVFWLLSVASEVKPMLEIRQLGFDYDGGTTASMQFDLEVKPGEVLSLIGPSGSGKSTLLNLIAGFLEPNQGQILLDGESIEALPVARRPVTIVFQQHNLFPHLDLYTNVALGVDPSLRLTPAQDEAVTAALVQLGLDGLQSRKPGELSGGQRQRAALARALVRERKILLLDEAFAALGPAQRSELIELVKELVRVNAMAALLVSHQPRDALLASARTAFICDGRVTALDATAELLQHSSLPAVRNYLGAL